MAKEELQVEENTYNVSCIKHGTICPIVPEKAVSNVILAHQGAYKCSDDGINVESRGNEGTPIPRVQNPN